VNLLKDKIARERMRIPELEALYSQTAANPRLGAWAVSSLESLEPEQTWRAIWLLRRVAKTRELSVEELGALTEKVDMAEHWIARLNLCQLFAATGVPASLREDLFPFLRESFADRRQIIRAWAISALATFQDDPCYRPEIKALLRNARKEKGKAMQARLRRLTPAGALIKTRAGDSGKFS